jgi:hypothetical protein
MVGQKWHFTIVVGSVTLTLGLNNGLNRYEGFSDNSRLLIRQDPWGTWSACLVKRNGKGSMVSVSGNYYTPEEAGHALMEEAVRFGNSIDEFVGKETKI